MDFSKFANQLRFDASTNINLNQNTPIINTSREDIYYYSDNWINLNFPPEYLEQLKICIEFCRPDMYFNYLFRLIVKFDFENLNKEVSDLAEIFKCYKKIAFKFLEEDCYIFPQESSQHFISETIHWNTHHLNYKKEISFYKSAILDYINFHAETYPILNIKSKENPYFNDNSIKFFQNTMFIGFQIALKRIEDDLFSKRFFGSEIVSYGKNINLIIYLTPFGMTNLSSIFSLSKEEKLNMVYNYLKCIGFTIILDESKLQSLTTTILLEKNGFFFYHKKPYPDFTNSFMIDKLRMPFLRSILLQSQANFLNIDL